MSINNRYFLFLSYNGKNYHGWQNQPNALSVQSVIEKNLSLLFKQPVEITGAGRTDSGVHAPYMVAHFNLLQKITNTQETIFKLNRMLPEDISVFNLKLVTPNAHARFDATQRTYQYKIHQKKNPFLTNSSYFLYGNLDFNLMNNACNLLINHKDFACFCKSHTDVKTTFCEVYQAQWKMIQLNEWVFEISANRFLRNMVRAIVGTLLEIGQHKITPSQFQAILESKNRSEAKQSVAAHALYLCDIKYPLNLFLSQ